MNDLLVIKPILLKYSTIQASLKNETSPNFNDLLEQLTKLKEQLKKYYEKYYIINNQYNERIKEDIEKNNIVFASYISEKLHEIDQSIENIKQINNAITANSHKERLNDLPSMINACELLNNQTTKNRLTELSNKSTLEDIEQEEISAYREMLKAALYAFAYKIFNQLSKNNFATANYELGNIYFTRSDNNPEENLKNKILACFYFSQSGDNCIKNEFVRACRELMYVALEKKPENDLNETSNTALQKELLKQLDQLFSFEKPIKKQILVLFYLDLLLKISFNEEKDELQLFKQALSAIALLPKFSMLPAGAEIIAKLKVIIQAHYISKLDGEFKAAFIKFCTNSYFGSFLLSSDMDNLAKMLCHWQQSCIMQAPAKKLEFLGNGIEKLLAINTNCYIPMFGFNTNYIPGFLELTSQFINEFAGVLEQATQNKTLDKVSILWVKQLTSFKATVFLSQVTNDNQKIDFSKLKKVLLKMMTKPTEYMLKASRWKASTTNSFNDGKQEESTDQLEIKPQI